MIIWQKETLKKWVKYIIFWVLAQVLLIMIKEMKKKKNYNCDVTYATNSELGFDYLRDNEIFKKRNDSKRTFLCNS